MFNGKIIFLDCDGVLNSTDYIKSVGRKFDDPKNQIDPNAVALLNKITDQTGAAIVVSSTWRYAFKYYLNLLQDCLASYGITGQVIGMTPELDRDGLTRSDEIQKWLDDNSDLDVKSFVILDDDSIRGSLNNKVIRTDVQYGLQDQHVQMAINILGIK